MKKTILSLSLAFVLALSVMGVACGGGNSDSTGDGNRTYDITVWVGERTDALTRNQIDRFNKTNEWGVTFNATVEVVSESKAMGNAESTPATCADIFCVAQDQLARGVRTELLAKLNSASVDFIKSNNDAASVEAASIGETVRAFPMTSDNGIFMYYDKRVIPEEDIGSLEKIIEDVENYRDDQNRRRYFSMPLADEGGWYSVLFFFATGCDCEWTIDENGHFIDYNDTLNSDNGVIALRGMQRLLRSTQHIDSSKASDFNAATPSAVVISGIWDYRTAQEALGDNLGVAPLPSFTVDGQSYKLVTYLGSKLMCVKPQQDAYKALYLQKLAMFLTDEECQTERYREVGWGPSNKEAAKGASSPALDVLKNNETVPQGQYPEEWWTELDVLVGSSKTSNESMFSTLLQEYEAKLADMRS